MNIESQTGKIAIAVGVTLGSLAIGYKLVKIIGVEREKAAEHKRAKELANGYLTISVTFGGSAETRNRKTSAYAHLVLIGSGKLKSTVADVERVWNSIID